MYRLPWLPNFQKLGGRGGGTEWQGDPSHHTTACRSQPPCTVRPLQQHSSVLSSLFTTHCFSFFGFVFVEVGVSSFRHARSGSTTCGPCSQQFLGLLQQFLHRSIKPCRPCASTASSDRPYARTSLSPLFSSLFSPPVLQMV